MKTANQVAHAHLASGTTTGSMRLCDEFNIHTFTPDYAHTYIGAANQAASHLGLVPLCVVYRVYVYRVVFFELSTNIYKIVLCVFICCLMLGSTNCDFVFVYPIRIDSFVRTKYAVYTFSFRNINCISNKRLSERSSFFKQKNR